MQKTYRYLAALPSLLRSPARIGRSSTGRSRPRRVRRSTGTSGLKTQKANPEEK